MKPPKHLRIGPHTYRVVPDLDGLLEGQDVGCCNPDRQVIGYSPGLPSGATADLLCHETTHAMCASLKLEAETEEAICLIFGPGLVGLIRDNPKFVRFIQESA